MGQLKLEVTEHERAVLAVLLQTELQRGERDGTEGTPWYEAVQTISKQVEGRDAHRIVMEGELNA